MNQHTNIIKSLVIIALIVGFSAWLGVAIVTEQAQTILLISAAALLITCCVLGKRIWLLLIFLSAVDVPVIRGFGTTEIAQFLFLGFTLFITLMRRQSYNFRFGELEFWMLMMAASIAQTYARNPVGIAMFGAEDVGGRPYFMSLMSFMTCMVLANIVVKPTDLKWALRLSMIGSLMGAFLYQFRLRLGMESQGFVHSRQLDDGRDATRIDFLTPLARESARIISAYISPLRATIRPFWGIFLLFTHAAATMSGYRNVVAYCGMVLLAGIAYRGGTKAVMASAIIGMFFLLMLAFLNLNMPLPPNVQRALSPLPGTWEQSYRNSAEVTTEWRVEMWKEAIFTDYWIRNKMFGDGLGFTRRELEMMDNVNAGGGRLDNRGSGMTSQQESMMVTGGYHSGPVQTVRTVGYVGLVILLIAMIRVAVHAHRQIIRCRNTEYYACALYFGIPAIILPVFFTFVIGSFAKATALLFFSYAIVRILEKNLTKAHISYSRETSS